MESDKSRRVDEAPDHSGITRREYIGAVTGSLAMGLPLTSDAADTNGTAAGAAPVTLKVNGQQHSWNLDPRVTLLDLLRERLSLTGTKKGCDHGQCGACTVLSNGRRINSCLSLAVTHDGDDVVTVEGLAHGADLHPVQAAFIEHDGFQCGYCTPGQICSAVALLDEARRGDASVVTPDLHAGGPVTLTADEVRERMSGNICRCGAYPGIVAAVQACTGKTGRNG